MKLSDFVDLIEEHEFMADSQIASIRRQMAAGKLDMTIDELAKFLIDRRRLTKYQARRVLAELKAGQRATSIPMSEGRRRAQNRWLQAAPVEEEIAEVGPDNLVPLEEEITPPDPLAADPLAADPLAVDPLAVDLLDLSTYDPLEAQAEPLNGKPHQKVKQRKNPWDSPLLLFGGGGLVVMLLVGGLLYFWLAFDSGDELFQAAEKSYRNGSYVQATAEYDRFLRRFPDHPRASLAQVRRSMAALWRSVESTTDWETALTTSQRILPEIDDLAAFDEARAELATLLPEIAGGLAEQAQQAQSLEEKERQVQLAADALQLVNDPNYLPTSLRQAQQRRIDAVDLSLAHTRRDIERDQARDEALRQITELAATGDFPGVYQRRRDLITRYPALRLDDVVNQAVSAAAVQLVDQVQAVSQFPEPQTDDPRAAAIKKQIVLAERSAGQPVDETGDVAVFRLGGAVYAFDLASGSLLWRRYVGLDPHAQPVSWQAEGGPRRVVLVDAARDELLMLDARRGTLVWRHTFSSRLFRPILREEALLVAEESGKVWKIAAGSGQVQAAIQLPQPVAVPLGMLSDVPALYAVAEHSNVFVLSTDDLTCSEVIPVGHESGTIQVAPTGTLRHLFLYENAGLEYSFLHLLTVDALGGNAQSAQDTVRLEGQVLVPPLVSDARVISTNDRGEVWVHEVNLAAKDTPVRLVAATRSDHRQPIVSYPAIDRGTLWVGDQRLTRYVTQLSRGSVVRKMVAHDGDIFVAPLQIHKDVLIHARRQGSADGYVVAAQRIGPNQLENLWETTVGVATAGEAFALQDLPQPWIATSRGSLFALPQANDGTFRVIDQPQAQVESSTRRFRFHAAASVGPTSRVYFPQAGDNASLWVESAQGKVRSRLVEWEVPASARACEPAAWNGLILVPTKLGQVMALDPATGAADVHPFQPELAIGELIDWATPVSVPTTPPAAVLSDRQFRLFRLGLQDKPEPHLVELDKVTLSEPLTGPMAAAGLMLVAVGRHENHEALHLFQLPELAPQDPIVLSGELVLPPREVGGAVYCATTEEGLLAIRDDFRLAWALDTEGATPVAGPIAMDGRLVVAFAEGQVWLIDTETGQRVARYEVGEPLAGNLSHVGGRLWAHGYDGTLHAITWEEATP